LTLILKRLNDGDALGIKELAKEFNVFDILPIDKSRGF